MGQSFFRGGLVEIECKLGILLVHKTRPEKAYRKFVVCLADPVIPIPNG